MEQPLAKAAAERIIRHAASLPLGVEYRSHCWERMAQRHVDPLDVVRLLRSGEVIGIAYRRNGEWRYRVRERTGNAPADRKRLRVVVVVVTEHRVSCQTVYRDREG
jgi:hypothetical protein